MYTYLSQKFEDLELISNEYSDIFKKNKPFPYISFENFFDEDFLTSILDDFPDLSNTKKSHQFDSPRDKKKFATQPGFEFPAKINGFLNFLNSYKFLNFLQSLTGINETLIPDPYYAGGGLHEIKKGGFLKIHSDFNYHPALKLDRRLNLLIYLNKNWNESYGGQLELWNKDMTKCEKKNKSIF